MIIFAIVASLMNLKIYLIFKTTYFFSKIITKIKIKLVLPEQPQYFMRRECFFFSGSHFFNHSSPQNSLSKDNYCLRGQRQRFHQRPGGTTWGVTFWHHHRALTAHAGESSLPKCRIYSYSLYPIKSTTGAGRKPVFSSIFRITTLERRKKSRERVLKTG